MLKMALAAAKEILDLLLNGLRTRTRSHPAATPHGSPVSYIRVSFLIPL